MFALTWVNCLSSYLNHVRWHGKSLAKLFDHSSKKTRAEKLMALLVESGVLYCLIWVGLFSCSSRPCTERIDSYDA